MTIGLLGNLVLTEVLFAIVYVVAIFVLWEFIRARDGMLRKIMIAYFSVEIFMYLGSAIYFYTAWYKHPIMNPDAFRVIVILPKVVIKLWLLWWLKRGRYEKQIDSFH